MSAEIDITDPAELRLDPEPVEVEISDPAAVRLDAGPRGFLGLDASDLLRGNALTTTAMAAKDAFDVLTGDKEKTQKLRAFLQGITLNHAGKLTGEEQLYKQAAQEYPAQQVIGSVALPTPGLGALKGIKGVAGTAARVGASSLIGAGMGAASAHGADQDLGEGALIGGLGGAAGGVLGEILTPSAANEAAEQAPGMWGKVKNWVHGKVSGAAADQATADEAARLAGIRSAQGQLGQEAQNIVRKWEHAQAVASGKFPGDVEAARAYLSDPNRLEVVRKASANAMKYNAGEGLEAAEQALADAVAVDAGKMTEEALAHPIRDQVWPRVKKQVIDRVVKPVVAAKVGGPAAAAAVMMVGGRPGTAWENMANNPSVRHMGWRAVQKALIESPESLGRFAAPLLKASVTPAGLSAAMYVLHEKDPEFRAKMQELSGPVDDSR